MLTSGLALLLACVAFAAYEVMAFRTAMVQNLSTLAEIIGNNTSAALDFSDPKAAKETLSALRAQPNIEAGCIYTVKGEVFAVYERTGNENAFVPPKLQQNTEYFSKDSLHLFRPILRDGENIGTVYVVSDLNALYSRLDKYGLIAIGVFFASGLVAFLLSSQLGRLISGPILNLVQTAHTVTSGKNYSVRATKQSDDELGVLIDAFNEMLKQIQERDAALQTSHLELENRVKERTEEVVNSLSLVHATLESTTDGILAVDGRGGTTSFNQKFLDMWRVPLEIARSRDTDQMRNFVLPQLKNPDQFLSKIKELYADPEKESFDLLEFKDGRIFERYSKAQRIEEKCVGRVWSFRDVTERKRAEEQLERLGNEYKAVLNSLGEGVHWLGGDGKIKFENPIAAKMLGYEVSELIDKPAHVTMHHTRADGDAYPIEECPIYATLKDGLVRHVQDEVFWRKDGTSFPVEYTCTPIYDENGRHAGTVVIFTDVTESRRAQAQIEENRQLLDSVLKNSVDGIVAYEVIRDKQGDLMDFRFLLINPAAERLLGKPAAEVVGMGLLDTFPNIVLDGLFEAFVRIIDTGTTLDFEYSTVRSGDMRWYRVAGVKLGDGLVMSYSDITERKRSEAEMEQMHKQLLETSRQAGMAEVATSVLHNVGNVLNSVNVSSTLVSNQVRKSKVANLSKVVALLNEHATDIGTFLTSDPKGKQLPGYLGQLTEYLVSEQKTILDELTLLHQNIEHIKDIVVMQQSYARISGIVETVKITDLVEDALRMNLGALQRHGVDVIREYEDVPPVDVEKHKILQILVNLVRNAKYACDESVRTDKLMTLRVTRSDELIKISIIDNGIGIPPENLTRIFNHGFTTRKEGHGFGLHSAVLAAMEMGGSLTVHSDGPNKGAIFTLELPYKPHEAPHDK